MDNDKKCIYNLNLKIPTLLPRNKSRQRFSRFFFFWSALLHYCLTLNYLIIVYDSIHVFFFFLYPKWLFYVVIICYGSESFLFHIDCVARDLNNFRGFFFFCFSLRISENLHCPIQNLCTILYFLFFYSTYRNSIQYYSFIVECYRCFQNWIIAFHHQCQ